MNRILYFGKYGSDVMDLQLKLQELGYSTFSPTNFFGIKTHLAVRRFQVDNNLPANGVFAETESGIMGLKPKLSNSELLFQTALGFVGKDVTPQDNVPDDVACCETIDTIYKACFGEFVSGAGITVSTLKMLDVLMHSPKFQRVFQLEKGDILLYATDTGNGNLKNGHIFISDGNGKLYSNTSSNGLFLQNYTTATADHRYGYIGGFPAYYFKKL